jgi:hypothetical protein
MRKIFLLSIFLFVAAVCFVSCREMDKDYKEYVVPNGIIYPQKIDSLKIYPGLNRVKIEWIRPIDPKVIKARIYWNNYTDSVSVDIPADKDTISVMIDNLKENTYTFYVKTFDADGNFSIPSDVTGDAYGENFAKTLNSRQLTMATFNDRVELYWGAVESTVTKVAIRYLSSSGQTVEEEIPFDETQRIITDFKRDGTITIITHHIPFPKALDEVASSSELAFPDIPGEVLIPRDRFKNAALPGDYFTAYAGAYALENIWDGGIYNLYASALLSPPKMPQYFTIDLGRSVVVYRFKLYPRSGGLELYKGAGPRFFELWGSMDPPADGSWDNWYKLGEWEQHKPSGYGAGANVGPVTEEDIAWFNSGGNYVIEATDDIPSPFVVVKFLRFKINHTFDSYAGAASGNVVIAEMEFYGGAL